MVRRHIDRNTKLLVLRMRERTSAEKIKQLTGISDRLVRRWVALHRATGDVVHVPVIPGRPRLLSGLDTAFIEGCIERQPDIYLEELRELLLRVCRVEASCSTISRTLRRRGFSRKLITRPAKERDEADRALYQAIVGMHYRPYQFVFVDESAFNRHTSRRRFGWAPFGNRARRRDVHVRGHKYSILPALSLDGIRHCVIRRGSFNSALFIDFVRGLLREMNPFPGSNSVIVMDNASIHKSEELRALVTDHGMRVLFFPAYSPDYNPIEEAFSFIKHALRRNQQYVDQELGRGGDFDAINLLLEIVYSISRHDAEGWFRHSNYIA